MSSDPVIEYDSRLVNKKKPARRLASSSHPTLEQWFEGPVIQVLNSSDSLGWNNTRLLCSRQQPTRDWYAAPITDDYFLVALLQGNTRLKGQFNSSPIFDQLVIPGSLNLNPPQFEAHALWDAPTTAAYLQISHHLMTTLADGTFREDPVHVRLVQKYNFFDPLLFELVRTLCDELNQTNPLGALYAESLMHTIVLHLLSKHSNITVIPGASRGRLTASQVRAVEEYIREHLDQKISLEDLAHCVHVSVSHFERLFRTTFGYPPYRYVLKCRIEKAKSLLCHKTLSLHEVARQCGFANQSHFTKHFSHFVGVSPAQFAAIAKS